MPLSAHFFYSIILMMFIALDNESNCRKIIKAISFIGIILSGISILIYLFSTVIYIVSFSWSMALSKGFSVIVILGFLIFYYIIFILYKDEDDN